MTSNTVTAAPELPRPLTGESLEAKLRRVGNPARMLRNAASGRFKSPYPDQYTSWQDEQRGWATTATLFDQSHHMSDVYFKGPDVVRLLIYGYG